MSKKKTITKKAPAKKSAFKSKPSKKAKSTEQLRKEAIADADRNIANADAKAAARGAPKPNAAGKVKANAGANTGQPRTPKAKPARPTGKPSGLDHAAKVLADAKKPLNAKTIAERAIAAGWKTNGATPHATLYAAMIREITTKGDEARFRKVDRGQFEVAKAASK